MLAIGRALMADPKVILLDEPSMGLAPITVQEVFDTIRRLMEVGTTLLPSGGGGMKKGTREFPGPPPIDR